VPAVPVILHVDMDSFFASVEVLDNPELAGKPVIVGGSGARGVVASCTYEARAFGVRSAMPSVRARQLCPQAIFLDGHYSRYAEVSGQLREILTSATPLVEPVGLDEAFLDVTGSIRLLGPAPVIGARIRSEVRSQLTLDCSVGGGRTKLVAKLASRAAKPTASRRGKVPGRGVVVIDPADELAFLHPMPVERLWGVGPATTRRLHGLGVQTVGELAALPEQALVRAVGKAHGMHLASLARGEDRDAVVPGRPAKSVGHEETFRTDIADRAVLGAHAHRMAESVANHLRSSGLASRTITVKVKFPDFSMVTRSHTLDFGLDTGKAIGAVAGALLDSVEIGDGVRLLGVSASGLHRAGGGRQLRFDLGGAGVAEVALPGLDDLDEVDRPSDERQARSYAASTRQETWQDVMAIVDAVRERFGTKAVGTASMVGPDGIDVPARRDAPWGPSAEED
jgi:DNA polymerase IV